MAWLSDSEKSFMICL